jgi:hypothetical protein
MNRRLQSFHLCTSEMIPSQRRSRSLTAGLKISKSKTFAICCALLLAKEFRLISLWIADASSVFRDAGPSGRHSGVNVRLP